MGKIGKPNLPTYQNYDVIYGSSLCFSKYRKLCSYEPKFYLIFCSFVLSRVQNRRAIVNCVPPCFETSHCRLNMTFAYILTSATHALFVSRDSLVKQCFMITLVRVENPDGKFLSIHLFTLYISVCCKI